MDRELLDWKDDIGIDIERWVLGKSCSYIYDDPAELYGSWAPISQEHPGRGVPEGGGKGRGGRDQQSEAQAALSNVYLQPEYLTLMSEEDKTVIVRRLSFKAEFYKKLNIL